MSYPPRTHPILGEAADEQVPQVWGATAFRISRASEEQGEFRTRGLLAEPGFFWRRDSLSTLQSARFSASTQKGGGDTALTASSPCLRTPLLVSCHFAHAWHACLPPVCTFGADPLALLDAQWFHCGRCICALPHSGIAHHVGSSHLAAPHFWRQPHGDNAMPCSLPPSSARAAHRLMCIALLSCESDNARGGGGAARNCFPKARRQGGQEGGGRRRGGRPNPDPSGLRPAAQQHPPPEASLRAAGAHRRKLTLGGGQSGAVAHGGRGDLRTVWMSETSAPIRKDLALRCPYSGNVSERPLLRL